MARGGDDQEGAPTLARSLTPRPALKEVYNDEHEQSRRP
jgi:hypothetical protein